VPTSFDEISHTALMDRVRARIADKRVLALVKAFLKAGILTERDTAQDSITGTPQGGILSPLLANVALSVLDEHFAKIPGGPQTSPKRRFTRRQKGLPNYRLIRYADDFVVLVSGTRAHTEALVPEVAAVLSTVGLRLSQDKTLITHIDEGLDFWAGASSATKSGEPTGITSITTRPRRPFGPSRPSARRSAGSTSACR
jgi:RNA-directed DNA polymerase